MTVSSDCDDAADKVIKKIISGTQGEFLRLL